MPVIIAVIVSNSSMEEGKGMSKGEGVLFLVDELGEREGERWASMLLCFLEVRTTNPSSYLMNPLPFI